MESRVRMKDIAERAGVSVVTVSKALSGMHGVSEQKRREIENLARKMGYVHPDQDARSGRQESDICVLTAERFFRVAPSMYKRMLELLSEEADSACCRLRSSFASDRMIREGTIPDEIVSGGEDGVIILGELGRVYREVKMRKVVYSSERRPNRINSTENPSWDFTQIIDSDLVYALRDGRVEESGDPDEIYKKGGIYKEIIDASARSLNIEKIAKTIG